MTTRDATVVVACHDAQNWDGIIAAVRSAQTQGAGALVVSVDHNPDLASRLTATLTEVRVVQNTAGPRGSSATRNKGAAEADTSLVVFLDDDEVAADGWLARLVEPFTDPDVIGTGGAYLPRWSAGGPPAWFPPELGWAVGASYTGLPTRTTPVRNVWSGNMAVRREPFLSLGGFDESLGKVGSAGRPEDTDLCIRASTATGGRWIYVPDAVIHHFVPPARSTFGFVLRRCWAEGAGKVEMRRRLGGDPMATESDYLLRTVPRGVLRHLLRPGRGWLRAATLTLALGSAALGGLLTLTRRPRRTPAPTPTDRLLKGIDA